MSAQANDAAELCRAGDEAGALAPGVTRGECINGLKGPSRNQANNYIAAVCGVDATQAALGV